MPTISKMIFYLIFTMLSTVLNTTAFKVKIKTAEGIIIGNREASVFDEKSYYAFYGVPYAQVPVGKLRFKNPKPPKKRKQPLDATIEYRGACAQAHIVHKTGQYGHEDCLYLNIYTPFLPKHSEEILNAVIVWIHGYEFTSSFSHIHGPDFLIENDVLFITLTHRLNAFGFLKINETDTNANMGLKDIILGLKWIRKNIKRFGGDKENITVMASGSACALLSIILTTKYKNLFSKIILQSGSLLSPSLFQGEHITEKEKLVNEIKKFGYSVLNIAPVDVITQASRKIYTSKDVINFQRPLIPFLPIIEKKSNNALITSNIYTVDMNSEKINFNIPILTGFTSQESITEMIPFVHNPQFLKAFEGLFRFKVPFSNRCRHVYSSPTYKEISDIIKKHYFKHGISENSLEDFLKYASDLYKYPIYKFIYLRIKLGYNIFVYKFNYIGKLNVAKATSLAGSNVKVKGAAQGDEICYILKCEPQWETYVKLKNQTNDRDRIFIKQISRMWANFAKSGRPTNSNNFENYTWLPMTSNEDNVFFIDKFYRLVNSKSERRMFTFWNKIFDAYYAPKKCRQFKDEL